MTAEPEIIPPTAAPKRPIEFTDEIFDLICERMTKANGCGKFAVTPQGTASQVWECRSGLALGLVIAHGCQQRCYSQQIKSEHHE